MSTSTLDEIHNHILKARAQCYRGIANQNERLAWGGRPSQFKIEIFEQAVAKYDRWLETLEALSRPSGGKLISPRAYEP